MSNLDDGDVIVCLQALERAIEYNQYLSQSETVDKDDYEEINYRYELVLNRLGKQYIAKSKKDSSLMPISKIIEYKIVE